MVGSGAGDPMVPQVARVRRVRRETAGVHTIEIDLGLGFEPGQFNMLYAFGVGEVAISISGDPADVGRLVHTVRDVGPVSGALARLKAGDSVGVRGPFGRGWPVKEAEGSDVLIVAGGLGLAPLRPAIYRLFAERQRYGRITLLYGARGPADILYRHELERWRRRLDVEIEVTVDHAGGDWYGHVGVVTSLLQHAEFDPPNTVAMVCGPEMMMRFAISGLVNARLGEDAIHLSMERNMKCAIGHCGHCQFGGDFICKDGPVLSFGRVRDRLMRVEI